jgi:PhnB protein
VQLRIGDATFMIRDAGLRETGGARTPLELGFSPVHLYLHVEDVDAVWKRALDAGAVVTFPLDDQPWGDRCGTFRDPYGHYWVVATRIAELRRT